MPKSNKSVTIMFSHHFLVRCDVSDLENPDQMIKAVGKYRSFLKESFIQEDENTETIETVKQPSGEYAYVNPIN